MTPPSPSPENPALEGILAAMQVIAAEFSRSNDQVASVIAENAEGNRVRVNSVAE